MPKLNKFLLATLLSSLLPTIFALEITIPADLKDNVAISIHEAGSNKSVYSYRDMTPMLIASNMKLVTSYVALKALSPSFRWQTQIAYSGTISGDQLNGNLYFIGSGDPTINTDTIYRLLESINTLGVKKINGDVIIDDHIFNSNVTSSELYPEPLASYSADPAGLIINSNLSALTVRIKNNQVNLNPDFKSYKIINKLTVSQQKYNCKDPSDYFSASKINDKTIQITGQIPKSCNNKQLPIYLLSNHNYDSYIIKRSIRNQNLEFTGDIRFAPAPRSGLVTVTSNYSPELSAIITDMNLQSNNLYAKTLFLSAGAYKTNNQNTYHDARQYYLSTLANNFDFTELAAGLENGSGLSRSEKMTTAHMNQLLDVIYNGPYQQIILNSLPSPGKDGTLQREFPAFANQFYAKTGSLSDTKAYSGYFFSPNGKKYSLSLVANNINQTQLQEFKQLTSNILTQLTK